MQGFGTPPAGSPGMVRGDLGRRLLAQLIDALWMMPLAFALVLLGLTLSGREALSAGADLMLNLVLALLVLRFWATRQATPGKWALGLRIVAAEDGGPVPFRRLVTRYLGYILSSLPLGLGFLWAAWDPRGQGWHDRLARTLVVRDLPPGAPPPGAPGGPGPPVRFG
jgi:uncharacterized RDD family membrane protein YckC